MVLPKSYRLRNRRDYETLFKNSRKVHTRFFVLFWRPAVSFRYGLTVSKRFGNSPERSRIKRQLRAILFNASKLGRFEESFELNIVLKRNTGPNTSAAFSKDLDSGIDKVLKLLRKS